MSDPEKNLDDFPAENRDRQAESMVGSYRAESTDQWAPASGITTKIPLHFDGSTSWFNFEEPIDDRLDLTVLEARIRGPALKITLVGNAEMHKRLFHRESLRAEDGVKYFGDKLRPHSIKEAQSDYLWRFYQFIRARRGNIEMVKWIDNYSLPLKRLRDAWMDMSPVSAMSQERGENPVSR